MSPSPSFDKPDDPQGPSDLVAELITQLNNVNLAADALAERIEELQADMQADRARAERELAERDRRVFRRMLAIGAALVVGAILIGLLSWGFLRQQSLIHDQQHAAKVQRCLNKANDSRAKAAQAFYEREVKKLYLQADGFQKLLDASRQHPQDQAKAFEGFDEFLVATKGAADGNAQVLQGLGIKTILTKDAQDHLTVTFQALPSQPRAVTC